MSIFVKRLIGLGIALAALAITSLIHSDAFETYLEDRQKIEEEDETENAKQQRD